MSTITKILIAAILVLGLAGGVAVAQASNGRDDPPGHLRGPCDEAEHRGDPRCAAGARPRADRNRVDDRQRRRRHRGEDRRHSRGSDDSGSGRSGRSGRSGPG